MCFNAGCALEVSFIGLSVFCMQVCISLVIKEELRNSIVQDSLNTIVTGCSELPRYWFTSLRGKVKVFVEVNSGRHNSAKWLISEEIVI